MRSDFLDAQLGSVADLAGAIGGSHGHADQGQLIDQIGDPVTGDVDGA